MPNSTKVIMDQFIFPLQTCFCNPATNKWLLTEPYNISPILGAIIFFSQIEMKIFQYASGFWEDQNKDNPICSHWIFLFSSYSIKKNHS